MVCLDNFYKSKGKPHSYCKACWKQKVKASPNKSSKETKKAYVLKSRFGLSLEDYHLLYTKQNGCCAICGKSITLFVDKKDFSNVACVDHNHTTGEVRGLLCNHCNTGIGLLKEDLSILENAAKYLKERGVK